MDSEKISAAEMNDKPHPMQGGPPGGPLVGAGCAGVGDPGKNWGHLVLAIDPDLLGDRETFSNKVSTLVEQVKATKKLPGVEEIFVPGERGNRQAAQVQASGTIDLEDNLLDELRKAAG